MILIYLFIFIILFISELLYFKIADRLNIIDRPNLRSSHTHITLRGGGIIFLLSIWIWAIYFGFQYLSFLVGLTAIAGISFFDDIKGVSNRIRLLFQFLSILLMFNDFGILNNVYWAYIICALIICVGIVNAFNFMDGINGITGGYSIAVILPLLYLNCTYHYIDNNLLIVTLLGILVFNFFNFRKTAKCFAGDVGSVTIAYIIVFAIGKLIITTGDLSYILLLSLYGVDTILTIIHRIILHENLGTAHRKHVYQLLANELRIPHVIVSIIYMIIQLCISAGLILLHNNRWIYSLCIILILCMVYVYIIKKYYKLHSEYCKSINYDNR